VLGRRKLGTWRSFCTPYIVLGLHHLYGNYVNPLTPELSPSAQRCLTRFFIVILLLEPCILLIYAGKTNKCNNYSFSLLIMYGSSYVLNLVAWCMNHATRHNTPIHNILLTASQLSISQKALGTLPGDGNVMPKHAGTTIHN
jgi:hypothetical protein